MEVAKGIGGTGGASLEEFRENAGMKRWMRRTVRKLGRSKPPANDSAKAAADALALLLKDVRREEQA